MRSLRLPAILVLAALRALAHAGEPLEPHDLWSAWEFDPGVAIPLALTAWLYLRGARRSRGVTAGQMAAFWSGWALLAIALVSPVHVMGESLFSAHMAQHEILMLGAAPLLAMSRPLTPFLWALPFAWRRAAGRWARTPVAHGAWRAITGPLFAWSFHGAVLWIWHAPALFQATLTSDLVHSLQHISFLFSALLFWWSLFYARGATGRGPAVVYIFTTALHTTVLGALLTFAPTPWYPAYAATAPAWGLTVLEDQQFGGLIMWVPAGVVYMATGLAIFAAWLRESGAPLGGRSYAE